MADGHHQVACDVLEEHGHWPVGVAGAAILHQRGDDPPTLKFDAPQEYLGIGMVRDADAAEQADHHYGDWGRSLDSLNNGDGTGFDDDGIDNGDGGDYDEDDEADWVTFGY